MMSYFPYQSDIKTTEDTMKQYENTDLSEMLIKREIEQSITYEPSLEKITSLTGVNEVQQQQQQKKNKTVKMITLNNVDFILFDNAMITCKILMDIVFAREVKGDIEIKDSQGNSYIIPCFSLKKFNDMMEKLYKSQ